MSFKVKFVTDMSVKAAFSSYIEVPVADYYDGDYEATPTNEAQTVPVAGKTMARDFAINPIPSNYGLITWNGATLTVS